MLCSIQIGCARLGMYDPESRRGVAVAPHAVSGRACASLGRTLRGVGPCAAGEGIPNCAAP